MGSDGPRQLSTASRMDSMVVRHLHWAMSDNGQGFFDRFLEFSNRTEQEHPKERNTCPQCQRGAGINSESWIACFERPAPAGERLDG
jgi:hypothetical protein